MPLPSLGLSFPLWRWWAGWFLRLLSGTCALEVYGCWWGEFCLLRMPTRDGEQGANLGRRAPSHFSWVLRPGEETLKTLLQVTPFSSHTILYFLCFICQLLAWVKEESWGWKFYGPLILPDHVSSYFFLFPPIMRLLKMVLSFRNEWSSHMVMNQTQRTMVPSMAELRSASERLRRRVTCQTSTHVVHFLD